MHFCLIRVPGLLELAAQATYSLNGCGEWQGLAGLERDQI